MTPSTSPSTGTSLVIGSLLAVAAACVVSAHRPAGPNADVLLAQTFAVPTPRPPLFFREEWRQTAMADASTDFNPSFPVTPAAVSNPNLELKVYDPNADRIPEYAKAPPAGSSPRDWTGTSCVILSGYNQDPPLTRVVYGEPSDPPNLWTGVCGPVAVTLRHRDGYVDLSGLAKLRWVTRVSGFHVVRPLVKLADGTWLIGDHATGSDRPGAGSGGSTDFLETEISFATVRWLPLDIARMVTTGTWVEKPDLTKVDEVGFADLLPGSGHGWGGFVNVGRLEVYGWPVTRTPSAPTAPAP